jgi:hypothetical protein
VESCQSFSVLESQSQQAVERQPLAITECDFPRKTVAIEANTDDVLEPPLCLLLPTVRGR